MYKLSHRNKTNIRSLQMSKFYAILMMSAAFTIPFVGLWIGIPH
ncbi:hypothetical protein phiOC_p082 [Ochrobactrum phage vB_OspM_OC]|nr:hypothetical protein phiOC_p082 [Ochrobactrum phage vB_OspM_OC]